ncbi:MAG TPA: DNA ligase D, partial [Candidatus Omnitrophota bacterium]|nr:DNA ligase D [Candidatus Omnitrophota bacterium]
IRDALKKGHLDIFLEGKKFWGEYSLVRTNEEKNEWLLIKKEEPLPDKDKYSSLDLEGAVEADLDSAIMPMLATPVSQPFDGKSWVFEVKWDGYRCLTEIKNGSVRLYSRNNLEQNSKFTLIEKELENFPYNAVFDGEVVVVDKNGRSDFQKLQNYLNNKGGRLLYYVFDILYFDKWDLRGMALSKRRAILEKIFPVSEIVKVSGYIAEKGVLFFEIAEKNGLEGIIAKNQNSKYSSGIRSREWLKIKAAKREEFVIGGFTEPKGSRKYFGALIVGLYENGSLRYAGHVGGGFDEDTLKNVHSRLKGLIKKDCPFAEVPGTNTKVSWVEPELICEVKFSEWTNEKNLRHPVFLGLRDDKKPSEVIKEGVGTTINVSNPEKIFWPKEGYTKKDVIDYYDAIAKKILPFLKDRPQSLYRSPNGTTEPGFFQKNYAQKVPDWVETVKIRSEGENRDIQYLVCQNKETLLFIANLGCIEINVWNSTIKDLERPDYIVFDLDPVDIAFESVIDVALAAKEVLDELGLVSYCKTSGSRGMHIYVPVRPVLDHEKVKDFARIVAMLISKKEGKITSLERSPSKRTGKVYIDYLQNRKGATMSAPYSIRPRPGATVSAPLAWKEVSQKLLPQQFTIRTMARRIALNHDPWNGFFESPGDILGAVDRLGPLIGRRS